ncbi:MAG: chloride channel protein [Candidatus Riflebacteria bacterium]|nr:chloride channel protein [Candidatus Riflebacteria bacterium]
MTLSAIGQTTRQVLLASLIGVCAGLGAIGFYLLLHLGIVVCQKAVIGYSAPEALGEAQVFQVETRPLTPWLFLVVPALGGVVSGFLVQKLAPEAAGHGTDSAIEAYHCKAGRLRDRVPLVKAVSAAITIGTGGSGGREGPIAQISAGAASWLGRLVALTDHERRTLMAAGMGAGVGAIFRAPLAGALFAAEILYSSAQLEPEVIVSSLIASIIAYTLYSSAMGWEPLFRVPDVGFQNALELVPYTVLALALTLAGYLFVHGFYGTHRLFRRLPGPAWAKVAFGGLLTGCVAFFLPGAAFTGYGEVQEALLGHRSAATLLLLALARVATTAFSIGSGGSGGLFGPSMVVGGCLGGAVGMFFLDVWPSLVTNPAAFVIVGMAGFFAGIARAPISTIIMVSEMTGNYRLLAPSMWVCVLTFLLCGRARLYRKQFEYRHESPAHWDEFPFRPFEGLAVESVMTREVETVPEVTPLAEARARLTESHHRFFPVLSRSGKVAGVLSFDWLRRLPLDDVAELQSLPVRDFMLTAAHLIPADVPLEQAAALLANRDVELLVVTATLDGTGLLGVLTRGDLLRVHQREQERRLAHDPGPAAASF